VRLNSLGKRNGGKEKNMKMRHLYIVMFFVFASCQSPNESIFKAVRYDAGKSLAIEIYPDYSYTLTVNDTIVDEGRAQLNEQQVVLIPKIENVLHTLSHRSEFEIRDNQLCTVLNTQQNSDSTLLLPPIKAIDDRECYEIIARRCN
jgi:hypothetical protein